MKIKILILGLGVLLLLSSITACRTDYRQVPDYEQVPRVLSLDKMLSDFRADYASANDKYAGNVYLFPSVTVDAVSNLYTDPRATTFYVQAKAARFVPEFSLDVESIGPGYILDITGRVRTWFPGSFYFVDNCSYVIVEGGQLPPPGGY